MKSISRVPRRKVLNFGFENTSSSSSFSFSTAVKDSASAKLSTAMAKKTFNRMSTEQNG